MAEPSEIATRAAQLGGPGSVPTLSDGDIFKLPRFETVFSAPAFPLAEGPVAMRFPSFGDEVEIEQLAVTRGGTLLARAQASIIVCLEVAPPSWWRPNPTPGGLPLPFPGRLPCSPQLVDLWSNWLKWRDSFRGPAEAEGGGASDESPERPVGGGPGA